MFTKKNFEQIAGLLAMVAPTKSEPPETMRHFLLTVNVFTELFESDNAKFDKGRFMAHMIGSMNGEQIEAMCDYKEVAGPTPSS
jgi:hypothetical protein